MNKFPYFFPMISLHGQNIAIYIKEKNHASGSRKKGIRKFNIGSVALKIYAIITNTINIISSHITSWSDNYTDKLESLQGIY